MKTILRKISFLIIILISNTCFAFDFHMDTMVSYKTCRKDFAVKQCSLYPDKYRCVKFYKDGQPYVTWDEVFKTIGERAKVMVQKINRRNTLIWRNHCIALPYNMSKNEMDFSPFSLINNNNKKFIIVDLGILAWGAYRDGKLVKWGIANGGIGKCKETGKNTCKTPIGEWEILEKKGPFSRSTLYPIDCGNKNVCGHPVFYIMKFHASAASIHGDKNIPGSNISHGCVRVLKQDAKWLSQEFAEIGTKVIILPY